LALFGSRRLPGGSWRLPEASQMLLEVPRGVQGPQAEGWLAGQGVPRLREQARRRVNG